MADMKTAIQVLRAEFPQAIVGEDNYRPYAKLPSGELFGIYFAEEHAGDPIWARGPAGITRFPGGNISSRNYEIVANLERDGDKVKVTWLSEKPGSMESSLEKLGLTEQEAMLELDRLNKLDSK